MFFVFFGTGFPPTPLARLQAKSVFALYRASCSRILFKNFNCFSRFTLEFGLFVATTGAILRIDSLDALGSSSLRRTCAPSRNRVPTSSPSALVPNPSIGWVLFPFARATSGFPRGRQEEVGSVKLRKFLRPPLDNANLGVDLGTEPGDCESELSSSADDDDEDDFEEDSSSSETSHIGSSSSSQLGSIIVDDLWFREKNAHY